MLLLVLLLLVSCCASGQAPAVFNMRVDSISWTALRVQWNTDITATSAQVQYDATKVTPPFAYATEFKSGAGKAHGYRVGGLAPATTYHYRVCSTANSLQTCSPVGTFTTLAAPATRFNPPTLPNEYVVSPLPTIYTGSYTVAQDCSDLQGKLDSAAAAPGSGNQLVLLPVARCKGAWTLKSRSGGGTGWIVVRPNVSLSALPPEGVRVDQSWASRMTTLSGNIAGRATVGNWRTSKWRLVGLQITHEPGISGKLMDLTTEAADVIVDRCLGYSSDSQTNLISLWGTRLALVNSSVIGSKPGSLMVAVDFTYGQRITIANNYVNVPGITLFGQGGDGITVTSDIVVRRNLVDWDAAFKDTMVVRQQFELKQARRALLEGNTFRNEWAGGETGVFSYVWAFTPRSSDVAATVENSQNEISDLTIRNNIAHDIPGGFQLYGAETDDVAPDVKGARRWLIDNLLMYNINGFWARKGTAARGAGWVFTGGLEDVVISHATVFNPRGWGPSVITWLEDRGAGIKIRNSLLGANPVPPYAGVRWNESSTGTLPPIDSSTPRTIMNSVVQAAPNPDPTFEFSGNVLIPGVTDAENSASYTDPTRAYSPAACSAYYASLGARCAGSSSTTTANAVFDSVGFRDWRNGDFSLLSTSPYYAGADGRPIGVDMDAMALAQGWVYAPTFSARQPGRARTMSYRVRDQAMQCYVQWNGGDPVADLTGSQMRRVTVPLRTSTWKLFCAGGSLTGTRAGEAAVYSGRL